MNKEREFRFVAEKVYSIPGRGIVVSGRVEKGQVSVGNEIGFLGADGKFSNALVTAIEVSRTLVEKAEAGQEASILLQGVKKEQITTGTVLMDVPEAPPAPVGPSPSQTLRSPQATTPPPMPDAATPIHPRSSLWRTVFYVVIGLIILLFLLFSQGKWDPRKKRFTHAEPFSISNQLSPVSLAQMRNADCGIKNSRH